MRKKALIILGASESSLLLIKKVESFYVILVDRNKQAPGFAWADEKICLSTHDPGPIISELEKLTNKYDFKGVITRSSGVPTVTAAVIANNFNLKGIDPILAEKIVHKANLMELCKETGISAPTSYTLSSLEEAKWEKIIFPAVLKPSLTVVGKKGVQIVNNKTEFIEKFEYTKKSSHNGWVDVETFEDGKDVILMAFSIKGQLFPVVLIDEINIFNHQGFVEPIGLMVPSNYSHRASEVNNFAQNIIEKFGIDTSILLFSLRVGESIKLIEIHLDLGGDKILDELLPLSSDVDFIQMAIDVVTGIDLILSKKEFKPVLMIFNKLKPHSKQQLASNGARLYADSKDKLISKLDEYKSKLREYKT